MQSRYLQFDKKDNKKVPGLPSSGVSQRKAEKVRGADWMCIRETWGEPTLLGLRGGLWCVARWEFE